MPITNRELIEMLTKWAIEFQRDEDYFKRNHHMYEGFSLTEEPDHFQRAAVLTAFLNFSGNKF